MSHVIDDLELYAVGALTAERREAIESHLRECAACRAAADDLAEVVATLADAVPLREPPAGLKERILAAASQDILRPAPLIRLPRVRGDLRILAMAAAIVLLLGFGAEQTLRLRTLEAEVADYDALALDIAHGGRSWYMAGVEQWRGSGGNLVQPASGQPAFVLFHDLRPVGAGQLYAVWLISPDGKWVRGANFRPDGREHQRVEVGQELAGFERCAVTVETSTTGKREGPVVMESRIVPPSPSPRSQ